jgi:hypothetical protein
MSSGVADGQVAPALFRLRAFEADWFRPLMSAVPPRILTHEPGAWAPGAALNLALALEAERWIRLGQKVQYFPDSAGQLEADLEQIARVGLDVGLDIFFPHEFSAGPGQGAFAAALGEAQESLTADRRSLLRLMFFESEVAFAMRLTEVREIAQALSHRPWLRLPPSAVARIAWSLEGIYAPGELSSSPESHPWMGPMSWRTTVSHTAWTKAGRWPEAFDYPNAGPRRDARARWKDLEPHRNAIFAATEWTIDYETAPAELRPMLAREVEIGGDTADDWLPTWARSEETVDDSPQG